MLDLTLEEALEELENLKNQYDDLVYDNRDLEKEIEELKWDKEDLEEKCQDSSDKYRMQVEDLEKLNHELTNELNLERDKNEEYWRNHFKDEITNWELNLKHSEDERIRLVDEVSRLKSLVDNLLWYGIKKLEM